VNSSDFEGILLNRGGFKNDLDLKFCKILPSCHPVYYFRTNIFFIKKETNNYEIIRK